MKLLNLLLILGLLFTAACSSKKKGDGGGDEVASTDEDYVEYILDDEEGDDEALDEEGEDGEEVADAGDGGDEGDEGEEGEDDEYYMDDDEEEDGDVADAGDEGEETQDLDVGDDGGESMADSGGGSNRVEISGEGDTYTVKPNETLMMVAFKIYGDYTMWRKLQAYNSLDGTSISSGQTLNYQKPTKKFVWNPEGLPYLIQRGDTLGTISSDKYGTSGKWRDIWNNNRPLIRDPNLIFAGFTLYYISGEDRDLASEQ